MRPFVTILTVWGAILVCSTGLWAQDNPGEHTYNGWYTGSYLDRVAFPMGGMGAGMVCLEGSGAWSHLSVANEPDVFNEPFAFAAVSVKGYQKGAKVLQGPLPTWKIFGRPNTGNGGGEFYYGLPRFDCARFQARFPFGLIEMTDDDLPLDVTLTGWSPFIPRDPDNSSLPVGAMEYQFTNTSDTSVEAVFSWNSKNLVKKNGNNSIEPFDGGFIMHQPGTEEHPEYRSCFAVFSDAPNAVVDHCWFRGGWFDALTILWKNIREQKLVQNEPQGKNPPGASLYVPFTVAPGASETIRLYFCWYTPETRLQIGGSPPEPGPAFQAGPSKGTASGQQDVFGFLGNGLINTYDPSGDGLTGTLTSPVFTITQPYMQFLIGGGGYVDQTAIQLIVDGEVVKDKAGANSEGLQLHTWDVRDYIGEAARIRIIDQATGGWGHINVDHIVFSRTVLNDLTVLGADDILFEDFEGPDFGLWEKQGPELPKSDEDEACCEKPAYYVPWYAGRFPSVNELADYWFNQYDHLRQRSLLFRDNFYASTLPPEVMEAVGANLTILKSPTILRTQDGRMWAWEGCSDSKGCCHGSCTHVWNYAQAIPHLFPSLERTLRETEFLISQNPEGHQTFRANLPLTEPVHQFHAASDGQLGGIMKVYREWRIHADDKWLERLYPQVKASMDYCIHTWDPDHLGVLIEPHHNTYDIEFWGPDGMCSSFYLGALSAIIEMSHYLDQPCQLYENLLKSGKAYVEKHLFNGEYFIQKIQWKGLRAPDPTEVTVGYGLGYSSEALELLLKEGPKYQYGNGCLSDGVLGMWMASVCGLPEVLDNQMVTSHLTSLHRYNLKTDLRDHDNPQRPTFAVGNEGGLLLCTWPKGGQLSLPFVYSNEVWTGIEYQVASHLMMKGEVSKGLDVVRACRDRYDGRIRNPFDEYECGHWYARALSSYALIQGLAGVRYDAVSQTLFIESQIGDNFEVFISTERGFGTVGLKEGEPFIHVAYGRIPVQKFEVIDQD